MKKPTKKQLEDQLWEAHVIEALDKGAEFYNGGWASGDEFIHSKMDKDRRLFTERNADGTYSHDWEKHCVICRAWVSVTTMPEGDICNKHIVLEAA